MRRVFLSRAAGTIVAIELGLASLHRRVVVDSWGFADTFDQKLPEIIGFGLDLQNCFELAQSRVLSLQEPGNKIGLPMGLPTRTIGHEMFKSEVDIGQGHLQLYLLY